MKLYVTAHSPYARLARIIRREKGLEGRVEEILAQTRQVGSPYYDINPSGRVPYLMRADGIGMEGSASICEYLDRLDGEPAFDRPSGPELWEVLRVEGLAHSLLEGLSVWIRELIRPKDGRFAGLIEHEQERVRRLLNVWDREIDNPLMHGPLNYAQLVLACALHLEYWNPTFIWRADHPKLEIWLKNLEDRPAFAATIAPSHLSLD